MSNLTGGTLVIFLFLIAYSVLGLVIEKKKPPFGHEASIIVMLGIIVSYLS